MSYACINHFDWLHLFTFAFTSLGEWVWTAYREGQRVQYGKFFVKGGHVFWFYIGVTAKVDKIFMKNLLIENEVLMIMYCYCGVVNLQQDIENHSRIMICCRWLHAYKCYIFTQFLRWDVQIFKIPAGTKTHLEQHIFNAKNGLGSHQESFILVITLTNLDNLNPALYMKHCYC